MPKDSMDQRSFNAWSFRARSLAGSDSVAGTGQTGSATLAGYGQQAAGLVGYARQSVSLSGNAQQSTTLESP